MIEAADIEVRPPVPVRTEPHLKKHALWATKYIGPIKDISNGDSRAYFLEISKLRCLAGAVEAQGFNPISANLLP